MAANGSNAPTLPNPDSLDTIRRILLKSKEDIAADYDSKRITLLDQLQSHLRSLTEDRNRLVEEVDSFLHQLHAGDIDSLIGIGSLPLFQSGESNNLELDLHGPNSLERRPHRDHRSTSLPALVYERHRDVDSLSLGTLIRVDASRHSSVQFPVQEIPEESVVGSGNVGHGAAEQESSINSNMSSNYASGQSSREASRPGSVESVRNNFYDSRNSSSNGRNSHANDDIAMAGNPEDSLASISLGHISIASASTASTAGSESLLPSFEANLTMDPELLNRPNIGAALEGGNNEVDERFTSSLNIHSLPTASLGTRSDPPTQPPSFEANLTLNPELHQSETSGHNDRGSLEQRPGGSFSSHFDSPSPLSSTRTSMRSDLEPTPSLLEVDSDRGSITTGTMSTLGLSSVLGKSLPALSSAGSVFEAAQDINDNLSHAKGSYLTQLLPIGSSDKDSLSLSLHTVEAGDSSIPSTHSDSGVGQVSFDFRGPLDMPDETITQLVSPFPHKLMLRDAAYHPQGNSHFISAGHQGLWMVNSNLEVGRIGETWSFGVCVSFDHMSLYSSGYSKVTKYGLRLEKLPENIGGFVVEDGKRLRGVAHSSAGLLAVADGDTKRVTIHRGDGERLYVISDVFGNGEPLRLDWLGTQVVCVRVSNGMDGWITCARGPTADNDSCTLLWKKTLVYPWTVSCVKGKVYVSHWNSPTLTIAGGNPGKITVLNSEGYKTRDEIECLGQQSSRVFEAEDGKLVAISYDPQDMDLAT